MLSKEKLLLEIDNNFEKIKKSRPLNEWELLELRKSLNVLFTYNSNAIEWNSFSLGETKILLEDGITIGWKTLREQKEILNHKELLEFLYSFVQDNIVFDEEILKKIHYLVLKWIDEENAWNYRKIQNYISWDIYIPPSPGQISVLMKNLFSWLNINKNNVHIAELVSIFHYDFAKIHPFIDGNWRVARLVVNLILMKHGYPMIIIPNIRRADYIKTLSSFSKREDFVIFMLDVINENLKDYLRMIGGI